MPQPARPRDFRYRKRWVCSTIPKRKGRRGRRHDNAVRRQQGRTHRGPVEQRAANHADGQQRIDHDRWTQVTLVDDHGGNDAVDRSKCGPANGRRAVRRVRPRTADTLVDELHGCQLRNGDGRGLDRDGWNRKRQCRDGFPDHRFRRLGGDEEAPATGPRGQWPRPSRSENGDTKVGSGARSLVTSRRRRLFPSAETAAQPCASASSRTPKTGTAPRYPRGCTNPGERTDAPTLNARLVKEAKQTVDTRRCRRNQQAPEQLETLRESRIERKSPRAGDRRARSVRTAGRPPARRRNQ